MPCGDGPKRPGCRRRQSLNPDAGGRIGVGLRCHRTELGLAVNGQNGTACAFLCPFVQFRRNRCAAGRMAGRIRRCRCRCGSGGSLHRWISNSKTSLTGPVRHGLLTKVIYRVQSPSAEMRGGFFRCGTSRSQAATAPISVSPRQRRLGPLLASRVPLPLHCSASHLMKFNQAEAPYEDTRSLHG
jgi:hypothetical protein